MHKDLQKLTCVLLFCRDVSCWLGWLAFGWFHSCLQSIKISEVTPREFGLFSLGTSWLWRFIKKKKKKSLKPVSLKDCTWAQFEVLHCRWFVTIPCSSSLLRLGCQAILGCLARLVCQLWQVDEAVWVAGFLPLGRIKASPCPPLSELPKDQYFLYCLFFK